VSRCCSLSNKFYVFRRLFRYPTQLPEASCLFVCFRHFSSASPPRALSLSRSFDHNDVRCRCDVMMNRLVQCCWERQLAFYLLFRNETTRAGKGKLSGRESCVGQLQSDRSLREKNRFAISCVTFSEKIFVDRSNEPIKLRSCSVTFTAHE
jgi:hypothetical protein